MDDESQLDGDTESPVFDVRAKGAATGLRCSVSLWATGRRNLKGRTELGGDRAGLVRSGTAAGHCDSVPVSATKAERTTEDSTDRQPPSTTFNRPSRHRQSGSRISVRDKSRDDDH